MRAFILTSLLVGCGDSPSLDLIRSRAADANDLVGVDSDRSGGLWMAYRTPTVGYYDLAAVHVVHVDAAGATLQKFRYTDTYTRVNGLAFTGDAVWINYGGGSGEDNRIRKLDPDTGVELDSFATEVGIVDLCSRDGELLLSNQWNQVFAVDREHGGELWRAEISAFADGGTQRGIAADDAGIWVLSQETDDLYLVDTLGEVTATESLPGTQSTYEQYTDHITWDGDALLVAHDGMLNWFEVLP